jgi:DNA repair photolyase
MKNQEIKREKAQGRQFVYSVDMTDQGMVFGQHLAPDDSDIRSLFFLRLEFSREQVVKLKSRYTFFNKDPLIRFESELQRLSKLGVLRRTQFYIGVLSDPFIPFEKGFDLTLKTLRLFEKYVPGHVTIQTRSPLIVLALTSFKALSPRLSVTIALETGVDRTVRHFTPELPSASERLKAARSLRSFGLEVTIQAAPLLPYGEREHDAWSFAQTLIEAADYIFVQAISDGTASSERRLRRSEVGMKLLREKAYWWLRPDTAEPLISALGALDPSKLALPRRPHLEDKQLKIFAA